MDGVAAGTRGEPGVDEALVALYREHRVGLVRLAVLLLGDRPSAEDAVQDVFAALWRRKHLPDGPAYLRSAVVNRCRSAQRRGFLARRRRPPAEEHVPGPEVPYEVGEEHRAVLGAIERLPRRQREVIVLRYYCDLSVAEVARTLGVHEGTVKAGSARALASLRRHLEEENR